MKTNIGWLFVCLLTSCASNSQLNKPVDGVVLEEQTRKPIAGAFVVAKWRHNGSDGYGSRTTCPHLEVVQTDSQGKFHIPAWPPGIVALGNLERSVWAFKPGYERVGKKVMTYAEGAAEEKEMIQRVYTGTGDARLDSYGTYWHLRGCGPEEDYTRKLIPLYRAIYEEATSLKVTESKKEALDANLIFFGGFGDENSVYCRECFCCRREAGKLK